MWGRSTPASRGLPKCPVSAGNVHLLEGQLPCRGCLLVSAMSRDLVPEFTVGRKQAA